MGWNFHNKPPMGWPLDYDSGLVPDAGFWPMSEGSGNIVNDLSGNRNTGIFQNGLGWTIGEFGSGILCDDLANKYCLVPNSPSLNFTGDFSVAIRFKTTDVGTNLGLVSKFNGVDTGYIIQCDNGIVRTWINGDVDEGPETITLNDGLEHTLVVVRSGSTIYRYIDGISDGSSATSGADTTTANDLWIGGYDLGHIINGEIYFVYIYEKVLSASGVALLDQEPFCMFMDPDELVLMGWNGEAPATILPQITNAYMRISA